MANNEQEGIYSKQFKQKEIGVPKNPFSVGQSEEKEEEKEERLPEKNDEPKEIRKGINLVPMIRKHASEAGALPPDSKLSEQAKQENWQNLEKEFKNKFNALKRGNKSLTVSTLKGPSGSQHFISKGQTNICSVTLGTKGILLRAGPEEKEFRFSEKKD